MFKIPPFQKIANWFSGKHTLWAIVFTITGTIMACKNILTPTYVSLVGIIQGFVFCHSVSQNIAEQNGVQVNNYTTGVQEATPGPGN